MKRIAFLLVAAVFVGTAVLPANAERRKPVKGGFDAQAVPFPLASMNVNGVWGCLAGVEGVHKVSHLFTAPYSGILKATVKDFLGDWDLYLIASDGAVIHAANRGISNGELGLPDSFKHQLAAGEETFITACNYAGGPTARVEYEFQYRPPARDRLPKINFVHAQEQRYQAPGLASEAPLSFWLACHVGYDVGCIHFDTFSTDRFVTVTIEDQVSPDVSAIVNYYMEGGGYRQVAICSETEQPVPLPAGIDGVWVDILLGPCKDGTPAQATQGTITATFSTYAD